MPKKFVGENSKAVAARARKTAVKEAELSKKQKEVEDSYWVDDNKHVAKKQQRKEDQERKKSQALEKKAETKALLEQELASIKKTTKPAPPSKVTRAQIDGNKATSSKATAPIVETHLTAPLEENINRLQMDGEEARSVLEAIDILSGKTGDADRHPEKRMKAAYTAYEEKRLKELKEDNSNLRLSQLKQMIYKEWQKSPENPMNQQ